MGKYAMGSCVTFPQAFSRSRFLSLTEAANRLERALAKGRVVDNILVL